MLFSERFGIPEPEKREWFDPLLFADTPLFIDPFLIFDDDKGIFAARHKVILSFFEHIFSLVAESGGDVQSGKWKSAIDLLSLHEVGELCLGYAKVGNPGGGSGEGLANDIARGIWAAIDRGIRDIVHFEQIQIFGEGIGPDRISDATACILRDDIAKYTESVAAEFKIDTRDFSYRKAIYSHELGRWKAGRYSLPVNPFSGKAILLVPKYYLRQLPTINSDDFWEYAYDTNPELLKKEFGSEISRRIDKETIVKLAIQHPDLRERYLKNREFTGSEPYDFKLDPSGYYKPYLAARSWARLENFSYLIQSEEDLKLALKKFLRRFSNYVENQDGWRLLWNEDKTEKKEYSFQALLMASLPEFCTSNDIDISKEANIGRGPVDFKLSRGYRLRLLIEAKKANNSKFWNGLKGQLPTYLKAEGIQQGIFLVGCYRSTDFTRLKRIEQVAKEVSRETGTQIDVFSIDCSYGPPSASKL